MKSGVNYSDRNAIKAMQAEGKTAEEISDELGVVLPCIKSFMGDEVETDEVDEDEEELE